MRTGQCYCGAVRYRLEGPLGPLVNCHCRYCRRAHGAAFATGALARSGDLRVTAGEDQLREYATSQGSRFFCGHCAGRLFNRPRSNPEITVVLVTSLHEEPEARPVMHVNVGSKAPWYEILDDLPQYEGFPPRSGAALELPSVAEVLGPILERVPREQRPLLVAIAERLAAQRYRGWATEPECEANRGPLDACAQREEEIADRVEGLYPDAATVQRDILAKNPDVREIDRDLFAGRPVSEQLAIQARAERLGAATWRSFAREAGSPFRETFRACALLEEESASVLEAILAAPP